MPDPTVPPKPKRRWLRLAAEALVFVAILGGMRAWQQRGVASGQAPALVGQMVDGSPFSLESLKGEPVLVHFWASWCGVCRAEQGSIQALSQRPGTRVITVASESGGEAKVARYMREQGLGFPTVVDEDGRLARAYGVKAMPTSLVIDAEGKIRFVEVGYTTRLGLLARLWLAGL